MSTNQVVVACTVSCLPSTYFHPPIVNGPRLCFGGSVSTLAKFMAIMFPDFPGSLQLKMVM